MNKKIKIEVALLNVLNALDCIFTINCVSSGKAIEINPIMAYFLDLHLLSFVAVKISLMLSCSLFLLYFSKRLWVSTSIDVLLVIYSIIVIYQIIFWVFL